VAASCCFGVVCVGVCDDLLYRVRGQLKARVIVCCSCGLEGDDGDLRGAVETEGKAYGADAAVDVELHLVEAVVAFRVLQAHWWQNKRPQKRYPNLATVGVAGEHEVDERAAGVGNDVVGVVGFVCHEQDRAVGLGWDGEIEVGMTGAGVFDAAEPQTSSRAFDGNVLIDENWGAMGGQGMGDHGAVEGDVVVAEDGIAKRYGEGSEDLGTAVNGVAAGDKAEGAVGDEVAGQENEVGGQGVDVVDDALEEEGLCVFIEMNVADLNDAIAVKGSG